MSKLSSQLDFVSRACKLLFSIPLKRRLSFAELRSVLIEAALSIIFESVYFPFHLHSFFEDQGETRKI